MIAINKEKQSIFPLRDMLMWTNHNMLSLLENFQKDCLLLNQVLNILNVILGRNQRIFV